MHDDRKLDQALKRSFQDKNPVFAWMLENSQIKKAQLQPYKITDKHMTFSLSEESRFLIEELWDSKRELKLYFEKDGLFVASRVQEVDETQLRVSRPHLHDFEERRDQKRYLIEDFKVKIESGDGKALIKNATDLSLGGFAVVLMKSESNPFEQGETVEVELVRAQKKAHAKVVKEDLIVPFEYSATPYGGRRLAFSFVEKDNEMSCELAKVFEKMSKTGI